MLQRAIKNNSIMPSSVKKTIPLTKKILGKKDLLLFAEIITEKLSEFNGSVEHLRKMLKENSNTNSIPGNIHEHGSDEETRMKNSILCQRESQIITGMLKALDRIHNHTYGICLECTKANHPKINFTETSVLEKISTIRRNSGNFIEFERLKAYPAAKTCIIHAKK
jgi:RNA polymerase-binding transcription factor DksA